MTRNTSTPRARWQKGNPMRDHDRLPPELRCYLSQAALPWSAASALKIWADELRRSGCKRRALDRLDRAARHTIQLETRAVWGPDHPSLTAP